MFYTVTQNRGNHPFVIAVFAMKSDADSWAESQSDGVYTYTVQEHKTAESAMKSFSESWV